jgi:hypothetical protein
VISPQKLTHKTLIVSLATVLILAALLAGCSSIPAMFPMPPITPTVHVPQVSNGLLAFNGVASLNERSDIYTMNPDGSGIQRLTNYPGHDFNPVWTPDGKRILFRSAKAHECLFLMNADGTNETCLLLGDEWLSLTDGQLDSFVWSPDGFKLAFSMQSSSVSFIYVMNADGSDLHRVSPPSVISVWPAWSPDSRRIVFADITSAGEEYHGKDLYVVNADGSHLYQLNNDIGEDSYPYWSPDSEHIFFTSNRDNQYSHLFKISLDGTNIERLIELENTGQERFWGIAPDRTRLLISAPIDAPPEQSHLIILNAFDFSVVDMIKIGFPAKAFWSPDGKQIFYQNSYERYHIMNVDGTEDRAVTISLEHAWDFSWQPVWK